MEVCSHIIDRAKENASRTNGSVLYFFCSSAKKSRRSTILIHTLLHQVICCSDDGKGSSIAAAFLSALVDGHQRLQDIREDDAPEKTVQKILSAPDNELIEALAEAIKESGIQGLSIIVDGLQENIVCLLFELIREATPKAKVLFTTQHPFGEIPHRVTYIEYDKERKGLHVRLLQP